MLQPRMLELEEVVAMHVQIQYSWTSEKVEQFTTFNDQHLKVF